MSSPVSENPDKRYMYAPPWARETPQQPPRAIVGAIERLRQERRRAAASSSGEAKADDARPESDRNQQQLPLGASDVFDIEAAMAGTVRTGRWTPRSLDPVMMPAPPKPQLDGPGWGTLMRFGGAICAAAIVALVLTGTLSLPSIGISFSPGESANAAPSANEVPGLRQAAALTQPVAVAAASASLPAPVARQPDAVAAGTKPSDVLAAYASLDDAEIELKPKGEAPPTAIAALQPKLPEIRAIERDEIDALIKRGQTLLAEGDIASARLVLRRAAEGGDANAMLVLAGTYDRVELAKLKVVGVAPDHAQAKHWYTKAVEQGSAEAVRRLQQLAQRAD